MTTKSILTNSLRLTPLSACLALAFAGGALATTSANKALPTGLHAASRMQMMHTRPRPAHSRQHAKAPGPAALDAVTNCLDDNSAGSLRAVVAGAASGDTIDLSGLTSASCPGSKITLLLGELAVGQSDLTFTGPPLAPDGSPALTIDANQNGRAIDVPGGTLEITNLAIVNGKLNADDAVAVGGCIYANLDVTLTNASVSNCTASGAYTSGGGIYSFTGGVTLVNSTVSNNTSLATATAAGTETQIQAVGGGVYSYAALTVTNSTISGNQATLGPVGTATTYNAFGGGIAISSRSTYNNSITGSTISGNSATFGGGAIVSGNLTVTNSTFSGNSSTSGSAPGGSGAISGYFAMDLTLQNSTIAFNSSQGYTGGVYAPGTGTMTISSTIISNNTAGDPAFDANLGAYNAITVAGANSLVTTSAAVVTFANPPLTADPVLLPLANYGGPTKTHALDPTSPAIDTGNNAAALTTDQRGTGFDRTVGAATDIGAYEANGIPDRIFADGFE